MNWRPFRKKTPEADAPPPSEPGAPRNRHVSASSIADGRAASPKLELPALIRESPAGPVDSVLAAIVIALIGFGVVMVYSASAIEATVRHSDAQFFLKRQGIYALIALFVMWAVSRFDYRRFKILTYPILVTVTGLLLAIVIGLGHKAGTAYRWIAVGPVHVQPSELAKLGIVIWLAYSLSKKGERVKSFAV
ncbi:MAG TPA: FtsW/RodA/SpoVE family cell cycle protein, partial [Polyangiaceae bacterium]